MRSCGCRPTDDAGLPAPSCRPPRPLRAGVRWLEGEGICARNGKNGPASIVKSPTGSSPSSKKDGCLGCSRGTLRRAAARCRRMQELRGVIQGSGSAGVVASAPMIARLRRPLTSQARCHPNIPCNREKLIAAFRCRADRADADKRTGHACAEQNMRTRHAAVLSSAIVPALRHRNRIASRGKYPV